MKKTVLLAAAFCLFTAVPIFSDESGGALPSGADTETDTSADMADDAGDGSTAEKETAVADRLQQLTKRLSAATDDKELCTYIEMGVENIWGSVYEADTGSQTLYYVKIDDYKNKISTYFLTEDENTAYNFYTAMEKSMEYGDPPADHAPENSLATTQYYYTHFNVPGRDALRPEYLSWYDSVTGAADSVAGVKSIMANLLPLPIGLWTARYYLLKE